ncbi:glycosyl transferase [Aureococcus anophagefferens]|nr:glycosyl transferase [Aureococcus anophagefferens]
MGSLLLLALLARCAAAAEEGLAVALHAQAYPVEGGVIVGSVMTTNGLKRALLRSGRVRVARSFYPFHYSGIADEAWDLVIIEGWFEMSNAFIHERDGRGDAGKRRARGGREPRRGPGRDGARGASAGGAPLVYVGSALGIETKANLVGILREAAASSWASSSGARAGPTSAPTTQAALPGILPHGAAACYGNASAVIGATMDGQRAAGMVNNRVFEALATGAPLVMETFPELEALFADLPEDGGASHLLLWREPGDVAKRVDALRRTADLGARTRRYMAERHTYDARAARVLAFFARVRAAKQKRCARHGCLRVAVVWSGEWTPQFGSSFGAAADLLADAYHLNWIAAREPHDLLVDAVWAVGPLGGAADLRARRLTRDFTTARRLHQRRLLVLLDDAARPAAGPGNHLTLVLRVEPPDGCDLDVAFRVELKSNVCGDVVAASDEVRVALPRRRPADPAAGPPPPPRAYAATEFLVWPYRPGCPD